jgi:hypothetical protein
VAVAASESRAVVMEASFMLAGGARKRTVLS